MAQATHTPAVTKTTVFEIKPACITLELNNQEASALLAVCRLIGGDPLATPRKYFDSISSALFNAGVQHVGYNYDDTRRSIYFKSVE